VWHSTSNSRSQTDSKTTCRHARSCEFVTRWAYIHAHLNVQVWRLIWQHTVLYFDMDIHLYILPYSYVRMYVYVCVCTCICIYMCTYTYIYMYNYIYIVI
jgi:hypothetical protein